MSQNGNSLPTNSNDATKPTLVSGNTAIPSSTTYDPPSTAPAHVGGGTGGAKGIQGINAYNNSNLNGFDLEPPDQGLCAGNGYVIESVNLVTQVYSTSLAPVSQMVNLASMVNATGTFHTSGQFSTYLLSDPRCIYDTGTSHWFLSFLYLGGQGVYSNSGPWPLGASVYGAEFVLVSQTSSPVGSWNVYYIDVSSDPSAGNCPCFGDQPLLGADANTIIISTNEFPIFQNGFNGAQVYLLDKAAMASGAASVNYAHFNIGQGLNPPDGNCATSGGFYCWYSVNPATSPTTSSYDTSNGGTAWAMSSLDFIGAGDNRVAVWSFTDTSSITTTPTITLNLYLGSNLDVYFNPGYLVRQKSGPIPLGDVVYSNSPAGCSSTCAEGLLATNGDGMWDTVIYAQGAVWGAVNTVVNQGTASTPAYYMGAAYWVVNAAGNSVSLASQGYVSVQGENLLFPSIGVGPHGSGIIAFTLSGQNFYPSTAFGRISKTSGGLIGGQVFVADKGQSPQDGFSEYQCISGSLDCQLNGVYYRPRWGDYTWAVWANGKVYFSTEYIQSPNCSDSAYTTDPTCGGTRGPFANWGTSVNVVTVGA